MRNIKKRLVDIKDENELAPHLEYEKIKVISYFVIVFLFYSILLMEQHMYQSFDSG